MTQFLMYIVILLVQHTSPAAEQNYYELVLPASQLQISHKISHVHTAAAAPWHLTSAGADFGFHAQLSLPKLHGDGKKSK